MDWFAWLNFLEFWCGAIGIRSLEWLMRTIAFAAHMWDKAWKLFYVWFEVVTFYVTQFWELARNFVKLWRERVFSIFRDWWEKIYRLFVDWWSRLYRVLVGWYGKLQNVFVDWWGRVTTLFYTWWVRCWQVFDDWWGIVTVWFRDWCSFLVNLFAEHREKIIYCLTQGWPRVWWFVYTRFELIFSDWENHIEGWVVFADDPALAIWNWVEPRLEELAADFVVRVW